METTYFETLGETVCRHTLTNGLQVIIVPKPDYHRVYGILTTNFGSVDQLVRHKVTGETREIPAGAAHFLEHKMFEGVNGEDAFALFMHQGAQANAFTNYFQTSYLFSASFEIERNIETLLDFVQVAHFTPEGIEKEKGIITQELFMYQDNPQFVAYQNSFHALYPQHAAGVDILGDYESINGTTYEDLRLCFDTFYHPTNMCLIIVGNVEIEHILSVIEQNQASKQFPMPEYERVVQPVTVPVVPLVEATTRMTQPIATMSWRFSELTVTKQDLLKQRLIGEFFFEMLVGPTSSHYHDWYVKGWVDTSFGFQYVAEAPMHHLQLIANTHYVDELMAEWESVLENWQSDENMTAEHLTLIKTGKMGDVFQMLNSLEYIAYEMIDSIFSDYEYFETVDYLQHITLEDVIAFGQQLFQTVQKSRTVLRPDKEQA